MPDRDGSERTMGHEPDFGPSDIYGPDEEGNYEQAGSTFSDDPILGQEGKGSVEEGYNLLSAENSSEYTEST